MGGYDADALARRTLGGLTIRSKLDAYRVEHGSINLTRQVVACGLTVAIVGANGCAYAPECWRGSRTSIREITPVSSSTTARRESADLRVRFERFQRLAAPYPSHSLPLTAKPWPCP
jgi:hypothetical protein